MATHNFVSSNSIGGIGEVIFFSLLSELGKADSVVNDSKWQKLGVDFVLDDVYYDTKFDTKAFSTGNIAVETVSVRKNGEVKKKGWVHTSKADAISYIYLENENWTVLLLSLPYLKRIIKEDSLKKKSIRNYGYESEVLLVPLERLKRVPKIRIPVVGGGKDITRLKKFHKNLKEKKK